MSEDKINEKETVIEELVTINDEKFYPCKTIKDDFWNGWAKPYFSKEVVYEILNDLSFKIIEETEDKIVFINKTNYLYTEDQTQETHRTELGWNLGAGCWIWDLKKEVRTEEYTEGNIYYKGICDCGERLDVLLEKETNQYAYRGSCKKCGEIFSVIVKNEDINKYLREGILYL